MSLEPSATLEADLAFVASLSPDHVPEFGRAALQVLQQQAPTKMFANAAKALGVEVAAVERGVQALGYVLLRGAQRALPAARLLDGVELALQPAALQALHAFYEEAGPALGALVSKALQLPAYHSLEWRLQVCVGGRHVAAAPPKPSLLLRVHTADGGATGPDAASATTTGHLLQADFANLRRMASELEAALVEDRSTHSRRMNKYSNAS